MRTDWLPAAAPRLKALRAAAAAYPSPPGSVSAGSVPVVLQAEGGHLCVRGKGPPEKIVIY